MTVKPSPRFHLIELALDINLADKLREDRAAGLTYDQIAAWFAEQNVAISREMIRRWVKDLNLEAVS